MQISTHTLTWSVTTRSYMKANLPQNFNSHAHVERDRKWQKIPIYTWISTHTLTWSVTYEFSKNSGRFNISTHTLTWSVTVTENSYIHMEEHFNSHAHVERDGVTLCT